MASKSSSSSASPGSTSGDRQTYVLDTSVLLADPGALTRFAESVIHQNVAEDVTTVRLVVHHDGRTTSGSASVVDDREQPSFLLEGARA